MFFNHFWVLYIYKKYSKHTYVYNKDYINNDPKLNNWIASTKRINTLYPVFKIKHSKRRLYIKQQYFQHRCTDLNNGQLNKNMSKNWRFFIKKMIRNIFKINWKDFVSSIKIENELKRIRWLQQNTFETGRWVHSNSC